MPDVQLSVYERRGFNSARKMPVRAATEDRPRLMRKALSAEEHGAALTAENARAEARGISNALRVAVRCQMCGRELTDPNSVELGIGPDCLEKIGGIEVWESTVSRATSPAEWEPPTNGIGDGRAADKRGTAPRPVTSRPLHLCGRCENPATMPSFGGDDGLCDECRLADVRHRSVADSVCECGREIVNLTGAHDRWYHLRRNGELVRSLPMTGNTGIHFGRPSQIPTCTGCEVRMMTAADPTRFVCGRCDGTVSIPRSYRPGKTRSALTPNGATDVVADEREVVPAGEGREPVSVGGLDIVGLMSRKFDPDPRRRAAYEMGGNYDPPTPDER